MPLTVPDRAVGSSLGRLIAFDRVWFHPQVFSMTGCLSPAFLVDNNDIVNKVRHTISPPIQHQTGHPEWVRGPRGRITTSGGNHG